MIVYWYLFSNHYTRECIHICEEERNVAPLKVPGLCIGPLLVVSACLLTDVLRVGLARWGRVAKEKKGTLLLASEMPVSISR